MSPKLHSCPSCGSIMPGSASGKALCRKCYRASRGEKGCRFLLISLALGGLFAWRLIHGATR